MERPKIILIMPSYNELENLKNIIPKIKKKINLLVLDDCSSDKSKEWLSKKNINFIKNNFRKGYIENLKSGFRYVLKYNYDYILTMDADNEHKVSCIDKFEKVAKKNPTIAIGVRNKKNRILEYILGFFFQIKYRIDDPLSGFKLYKKEFIKENINNIDNQLIGLDLLCSCLLNKKNKVIQVPISVNKRKGSSRFGNIFISNLKILKCFKLLLK
jgi:GT2 family glycosyltransferase